MFDNSMSPAESATLIINSRSVERSPPSGRASEFGYAVAVFPGGSFRATVRVDAPKIAMDF